MSSIRPSPEFGIVAACCRPRSLPDFADLVQARAAVPFDADRLLARARHHRVEGFVEEGLRTAGVLLPDAAARLLHARAQQSRLQMLRNAAEEVRLERLFRAAGLMPVFVKGASLAMLAHGSLAQKTAWDVDLLVTPERLAQARAVLEAADYRLDLPGIDDPLHLARYFRRNLETPWVNDARDTTVELHSALVETPAMLTGVRWPPPVQSVTIGTGATVTTLAAPELAAYLCVHGTGHCWARLKWLTDVAALVAQGDAAAFLSTATRLGAAHSAATALRLCATVLDMPTMAANRDTGPAAHWLFKASTRAIDRTGCAGEITVGERITALTAKIALIPRLSGRLTALGTLLDTSYTPNRLAVPDGLVRLHSFVWAPWRLLTRPWRRRQLGGGKTASKA